MDNLEYNWKKHAAQMISDDHQVERAFMDQAYQFLANKGSALMKDPYRLGFEIVHKNDSNTRMVGIFAFRVSSNLLYVPVFFLNGEIKGTDLLYRHDSKTFIPYEEQWIKYIISKASREMGRGIGNESDSRSPKDINLEDIAFPPGSYNSSKSASETPNVIKFAKELCAQAEPGALLKQFILEDGGFDAITKLASLMDANYNFASAVTDNIPMDAIMPVEMAKKMHSIKQAEEASAPRASLILSVGGIAQLKGIPTEDLAKAASNMAKRGYNLWDDRDSDDAKTTKPVYQDAESSITEITEEAGFWDIMLSDGTTREGFVATKSIYDVGEDVGNDWPSDCAMPHSERSGFGPAPVHIVFKDGSTCTSHEATFGELKKDQREAIKDLETTMNKGTAYRIFDAEAGTLSDPLYVVSKKKKSGVEFFTVHTNYSKEITIRKNPDIQETQLSSGVLGKDTYFIKVKVKNRKESEHASDRYQFDLVKPDVGVGSGAALKEWCLDNGVKEATIYHRDGDFQLRENFHNQTNQMNRPSMVVKLATVYSIHADAAEALVDVAVEKGVVNFMYGEPGGEKSAMMVELPGGVGHPTDPDYKSKLPPEAFTLPGDKGYDPNTSHYDEEGSWVGSVPAAAAAKYWRERAIQMQNEKSAAQTTLTDQPRFQTHRDNDFNVDLQHPEQYVLDSNTPQQAQPLQSIGDAFDPGMGMGAQEDGDGLPQGQLMSASPEELAQLAQGDDAPQIFEHGVVGTLVQTFDSVSMVDKYIPDMEQALDKLGRLLFLFYWKPRDFEDAYGSDDMINLENQILSNFRSFGELVLELLKKSESKRNGSVSLAGE